MKWAKKEEPKEGKGDRKGEGKRKGGKSARAEEEDWSWTWTADSYSDWWSWNDWGWDTKPSKGEAKEGKGKEKGKSKDSGKKGKGAKDDGEEKGKGKGKGKSEDSKGKKGGKGFAKGGESKGEGSRKGDAPPSPKTVAEVEAEMAKGKGKIERVKRSPDSGAKQPIETKGEICQVHKHSSMGCAVVSMQSASMREAIMNFAEQRFGRNAAGRVQMDIGDVKVQLKRHTDKQTKREVVTDIFVAWGHQQEKDSPLTVEDIAERFDQLYQEALASPAVEVPPASIPGAAGKAEAAAPPPPPASAAGPAGAAAAANPYLSAMTSNAAMNQYLQQQYLAQQAAAMAYHQQFAQQLMQMYGNQGAPWGKAGKGKGFGKGKDGKDGKGKAAGESAPFSAPAPADDVQETGAGGAGGAAEEGGGLADFTPAKPRLLQIVDPNSGKPIDTMGMNFAPRKPSTPLQITNPNTGKAVAIEAS
ncbi:unnamed protein product [Symbiodinium sp. CCMP2592]|nr:unnamed protein product [Symbiodinium sp. CCMP2592]